MALLSDRPVVVGIVNATPDSFYDGGRYADLVDRALALVDEGADWLDVGGESTRPGADPVDADEEWRRVAPIVEALAPDHPVSIDTSKVTVARRARDAGARILNDVTGLDDPEMAELSGAFEATIVMHMRGTPRSMRSLTAYDDVVDEVRAALVHRAQRARSAAVLIDPGIGFAKTAEQSLRLLKATSRLVQTGFPVLIGASRKSFIGRTLGIEQPDQRLFGSLAAAAAAYHGGASAFRVHDVRATREMLDMLEAIGRS